MLLDPLDLLGAEFGERVAFQGQAAERAVALVAPGAAGDLRHLGGGQAAAAVAVELGEAGEGDMVDVHVEAHADRVGGDEIIDLAGLVHRDLGVAGARAERAHHHRRAAAHPAQHLGDRIDLLGREGDDRRARRQPRELGRADIGEGREARPGGDLGLGQQRADHRLQALRAEDHRLLAAARVQHPVGEDMAALGIGAELRLVDRDEGEVPFHRHGFGRAAGTSARPRAGSSPRR